MEPIPPILKPPVSRRRWCIHLFLITAYIVAVGVSGWARQPARGPVLAHDIGGLLVVCGVQLLEFGLVLGLACWASRATRDDLLLRWRGTWQPVALGAGYSLALRLAIGLTVFVVVQALVITHVTTMDSLRSFLGGHRPHADALVDVTAMRNDPVYFWFTLIFVSFVVAGLREELWRSAFLAGLRALWPRYFESRAGQMGAVIIAAIFFGMAHVTQGGLAMAMAGLLGLGLGAIMVFHRSVWPAVLAHGLFDATSFGALPWVLKHAV